MGLTVTVTTSCGGIGARSPEAGPLILNVALCFECNSRGSGLEVDVQRLTSDLLGCRTTADSRGQDVADADHALERAALHDREVAKSVAEHQLGRLRGSR